jgi:hypothetical protein
MFFYKVKVLRCCNSPKTLIVEADKSQNAICIAATQLRGEGVTDAKSIEVVGKVKSLRHGMLGGRFPLRK